MKPVTNVCLEGLQMSDFQSNSFIKICPTKTHKVWKGNAKTSRNYCFVVIGFHISTQSPAGSLVEFEYMIDGWVNISLSHMITTLGS